MFLALVWNRAFRQLAGLPGVAPPGGGPGDERASTELEAWAGGTDLEVPTDPQTA